MSQNATQGLDQSLCHAGKTDGLTGWRGGGGVFLAGKVVKTARQACRLAGWKAKKFEGSKKQWGGQAPNQVFKR